MKLFEWPGVGFLLYMLCACIAGVVGLLLVLLISYVSIGIFVFGILSQGVGYG